LKGHLKDSINTEEKSVAPLFSWSQNLPKF
jgi:hypothetical protein